MTKPQCPESLLACPKDRVIQRMGLFFCAQNEQHLVSICFILSTAVQIDKRSLVLLTSLK